MILSMSGQAWLFLSTVLVGMAVGFFYDCFRIFRKVVRHATISVQIEDIIFWLAATVLVFYFMLHRNFGEIRPFALIGIVCGAVFYFATVSQIIIKVAVTVINFVKKVIVTVVGIIIMPLRFIFGAISPPVKKFCIGRRKNLRSVTRYGKIQMKKASRSWSILRKKV